MPHFFTSDGLRLHYEDSGTGQPLLCLAGLTRNGRDFDALAPHVTDLRLIRLDSRGRWRSDRDPDPMNYTVPREAADAVELLDHLGLGKVTILGTSRGGLIAMMLAASHPARLAGVILNDVGPVVGAEGLARIMDYVGRRPAAQTHAEAASAIKALMEPQFPGVPLAVWRHLAEAQYIQTESGLDLNYDPRLREALEAQFVDGPPPDLWPLFDALAPLPLGVLRGANSDIFEPATLAEMQARHPGLIAAEVPDRGHVPFLDEPQSLAVIRQVLGAAG
ncbi:MAG: alpha/beta hydrolase [Sedimentitalea sp.]|nr:alpha/beta hydrolase [Sedimentitalea sp.]